MNPISLITNLLIRQWLINKGMVLMWGEVAILKVENFQNCRMCNVVRRRPPQKLIKYNVIFKKIEMYCLLTFSSILASHSIVV